MHFDSIWTRLPFIAVMALAASSACSSGPAGGDPNPPYYSPDAGAPSTPPSPPPPPPPVGGGATQGGVQDMGLARELVEAGQVPPAEAFLVEGMFSEHDLGITGEPCERPFCLDSAMAVAPALDGATAGWMQLSLSSGIDLEDFDRPSQTLIFTVDVSGSMGWGYNGGESDTPGELSRRLLSRLVAELGPDDQMAIVTYGSSVATPLGLTAGDDREAAEAVIAALDTAGSTNMEAGLRRAYELAEQAVGETDETRVVLFTDVQPNVGATSATEFEKLALDGAEVGASISIMAVGLGLDQALVNAISHIRGGNAFSLFEHDDVGEFMDDNWPWFVSPLAYDLALTARTTQGVALADAYGFPAPDDASEVGFDVSTIFLSKRRGALLLRVTPADEDDGTGDPDEGDAGPGDAGPIDDAGPGDAGPIDDAGPGDAGPIDDAGPKPPSFPSFRMLAHLSYQSIDGELIEEELEGLYDGEALDERGHYYEQVGTAKTVALAVLVSAMREAAELYEDDQDEAVSIMTAARDRFAADAAAIGDDGISVELAFADSLLALMEEGAPQGDLYPR